MCSNGYEWCDGWKAFSGLTHGTPCAECCLDMRKEVDRLNLEIENLHGVLTEREAEADLAAVHATTIYNQGKELRRLQKVLSNRQDKIEELAAKLERAIDRPHGVQDEEDRQDEDPGYEIRRLHDHIHSLTRIIQNLTAVSG